MTMSNVLELKQRDDLTDKYQIVILDCPYDSIQDVDTQKIFSKFVASKLNGYMKEYPYGVLPFNVYDLVGTLLLLCEKKQGSELEPIMVFKSTSSERCKKFNLPFELFEYFQKPETEAYKNTVTGILESAQKHGVNVGYNSSWTIKKKIRENPELVKLVRDLSVMMITSYYTHYKINEVLIAGVVKFKVDKLLTYIGFEYFQSNGKVLPPISCPFLFGEQTAIMHLKHFSEEAKALALKYDKLWNSRLTIDITTLDEKTKVA